MSAVRVKEGSGNIHYGLASPVEHKPGLLRDYSDRSSLEVLFRRVSKELFLIFRRDHYGHSLLGFRDGKFRSVQTFVFLGNEVEIDFKAVRQFSDGY